MDNTQKKAIASWDDLDAIAEFTTDTILLPATSAAAGREIYVKIRPLGPLDLVKAMNFPMDEINAMIIQGSDEELFREKLAEHVRTFEAEDLNRMIEAAVRIGLVEPDPKTGDISKLRRDFEFIFGRITRMTVPQEVAEDGARFRGDGERASN